jgi:hypothetical protein
MHRQARETNLQQILRLCVGQRLEHVHVQAATLKRRAFPRAHRGNQSNARPADPTRDIRKHRRARPMQPIHIINHHKNRLNSSDGGQKSQRRDRDGLLLRSGPIDQAEGNAQRTLVDLLELAQLAKNGAQKLAEPSKAQRSLKVSSRGTKHPRAPTPRLRRNDIEQRRLANAGVAGQQQGTAVLGCLTHERPQKREIAFTPEESMG